MSLTDTFFPGNEEKKLKLAELAGELYSNLEYCFTATNNLIDCIEENFEGQKFEKIHVQKSETLKYNCKLINQRITEIKEYLEKKELEVKHLMGTELFTKLMSLDTDLKDTLHIASEALVETLVAGRIVGIGVTGVSIALIAIIKKLNVLPNVTQTLNVLRVIRMGGISLLVFTLGVDALISAIYGCIEESQLKAALDEYTKATEAFKPAAKTFYDNISMVRCMIQLKVRT